MIDPRTSMPDALDPNPDAPLEEDDSIEPAPFPGADDGPLSDDADAESQHATDPAMPADPMEALTGASGGEQTDGPIAPLLPM